MKKFRELVEAKETIVFTFGRFNPPTTGHEKLIQKVSSVAGSNPFRIYPSHTTNPKKDPLPHALKVAYMRKMFKKYSKNIIADKSMKTAIMIAEKLYSEGFKNLIMVVGSDRVKEFSTLLNRYNDAPDKRGNQLFKFDSVQVVSAGERDPDAEGVEGMSASKMRVAAADGDKDAFLTGLPSSFRDGEKLYRDVRKYMGIREERDMGDMTDFESVRDMLLTGKIWNAGDIVEANGITGEVVRKGTNYLSFVDEDGKVHKVWLHEITINEAKSPLQKLKDFDFVRTSLGKKAIFKDKEKKEESEFDEKLDGYSVYKKTATQAKNKSKTIYAFGRKSSLDGKPKEEGGYIVWKLEKRYDGHVRGGIAKNWAYEKMDLSYPDAVKLMNKKLGYKAFDEEVELDEGIRASRPRAGGGREGKAIEQNLAVHYKLMQDYIKQGMSKEKASKVAFNDMEKMKPKEFKKILASIKEETELDERNYRKEYDNYQGRPEQIARRSSRNKARRILGDKTKIGMDVGHIDNDPMNNDPKNLRNEDPSVNRREPRLREKDEVDEDIFDTIPWLGKLKRKLFDKTHTSQLDKLSFEYAKKAAKLLSNKKKVNHMQIIHDITRVYSNLSDRVLRDHINDLVKKGLIPKHLRAEHEPQHETLSFKEFVNQIQTNEVLSKDASIEDYIKDFVSSDAPQFKGKSKEKRKDMAIAAYHANKK